MVEVADWQEFTILQLEAEDSLRKQKRVVYEDASSPV